MRLFFTSLRVMYLHKLFEILHGRFVSSPPFICSVIYLHHCDHIFCVLSSTTLFFAEIVLALVIETSFSWFLWSFDKHPLFICVYVCVFVIFSIFILFGTVRYFKFILYIPCFIPRISHFFKEPWFFPVATDTRNQYIRNQIQIQDLRGRCDLLLLIC